MLLAHMQATTIPHMCSLHTCMLLQCCIHAVSHIIGERAKRARRYLVMFMETRDIYMYICTSVSNTHARVSVSRIKFKSKETEDFLA